MAVDLAVGGHHQRQHGSVDALFLGRYQPKENHDLLGLQRRHHRQADNPHANRFKMWCIDALPARMAALSDRNANGMIIFETLDSVRSSPREVSF